MSLHLRLGQQDQYLEGRDSLSRHHHDPVGLPALQTVVIGHRHRLELEVAFQADQSPLLRH